LAGGLVIGFGVLVLSIDAGEFLPPPSPPTSARRVRSNYVPRGGLVPSQRDGKLSTALKNLVTAQGRSGGQKSRSGFPACQFAARRKSLTCNAQTSEVSKTSEVSMAILSSGGRP